MTGRLTGSAIALALVLCPGSLPAQAERPPQPLHLVGDHWTAWDPPESLPPDAEVYIIVPGDTLWDLAARFLGNPYLWPQLWERNQYIRDAHWIYPGDPLVVGVKVEAVEDLDAAEAGAGDEGAPGETGEGVPGEGEGELPGAVAGGAPVPLGSESDIYCSGYIGDLEETFPYRIVGSEAEAEAHESGSGDGDLRGTYGTIGTLRYGMATGDIVYTDGGRAAGLAPGMVFTIIQPGAEVVHPVDGRVYGRQYRFTGRLRVMSVQDETTISEIIASCDPVIVGSALRPFEPEPVPLARRAVMRPPNMPTPAEGLGGAAVILGARDDLVSLGEDHVVFIDRGAADDVTPGDLYTIYRLNREGLPPVVVGELAVLSVHPRSSVARIVASRRTIYVGDRLEPE
jgi:hypothetical protein